MTVSDENCHKLATELRGVLDPYIAALRQFSASLPADIRLSLNIHQLLLFSALYGDHHRATALILQQTTRQAQQTIQSLNTLSDLLIVNTQWHLLEGELSPQETAGHIVSRLSQTIHYLLRPQPGHHFVVPAHALTARVPSRHAYHELELAIHQHETISLSEMARDLVARGYVRGSHPRRGGRAATEPGTFSIHGETIDLRLPHNGEQYTLVWHGPAVEQIIHLRAHAPQQTPRRSSVVSLTIPPTLFPPTTATVAEVLTDCHLLKPLAHQELSRGIIFDALHTDYPFPLQTMSQAPPDKPIYILYENYDRVAAYCRAHNITPALSCQTPAAHIPLSLQSETFSLLSESQLFVTTTPPRPLTHTQGLTLAAQLTPNKPAVHSEHGIGIFEGLQQRVINDIPREYLLLRYAAGDTLSVPVEYAHKVTPYLGSTMPPINRLQGTAWQTTRRKAQGDAQAFARELLEAARERAGHERTPYTIDPTLSAQLDQTFPYELTPDQQTALAALYHDLAQLQPLDRLLVGDVGFGKTELALRVARHVIASGKQVALLAPTTLLVQQHVDTARQRFPELTGRIGVLSRFSSAREQVNVREKIRRGSLQLIIGTHALLSRATHWATLGLVIIDEEQRFGVKHKEHFKKIRATVDFLSLSATPIPRTLSMALTGLKDLSVISTPPQGRQEVMTHVTRAADTVIQKALMRELQRGGQVYVVAPKVRSLGKYAHDIQRLAPDARVAIAHGQLPPAHLAEIMRQFDAGTTDILISSTIIENGLDLPHVNTLIVMEATNFGLSDLYQLRGRVGRRQTQGYAYFLYNHTELTALQRQRLTALTEASRLGSGWSLAQRDLEIRGAGNLLGAEQSGTVNQVGVQLYLDMVQEAIDEHEEPTLRRHDVDIQLPLPALIPTHYIAHDDERSSYYQKLSRARTLAELIEVRERMAATFGPPPSEVQGLELLLTLQHAAAATGVSRIESHSITPSNEDPYWRLAITARDVKKTLQKLQPLGLWSVRNNVLTHDLNDINPDFIRQLIAVLAAS